MILRDVRYVNSTLVDFDCNKYNTKIEICLKANIE